MQKDNIWESEDVLESASKILPKDIWMKLTLRDIEEAAKLFEDNKILIEVKNANLREAAWILSGCFEFIDKRAAESVGINEVKKAIGLKDAVDFRVAIQIASSIKDAQDMFLAAVILIKLIRRIKMYKEKRRQSLLKAWINKKEIS
jgi:hypothetical protein